MYYMFSSVFKYLFLLILHYIRNEINHRFYIFILSIIFIHPFNLKVKTFHSEKNIYKIVYFPPIFSRDRCNKNKN